MALYRRFAIYLYQYQGAKKGASAGFGMIELRNGRIRMQLTGRGNATQGNLEVYGLLDSPANMEGVRLGSMQAGRFVLEAGEDIGEGKLFSDLRGIVLTARPGNQNAIAALWNGTFDAGQFVQWKAPKDEQAVTISETGQEIYEPEIQQETDVPSDGVSEEESSESFDEIEQGMDAPENGQTTETAEEKPSENIIETKEIISLSETMQTEHLSESHLDFASTALDLVEIGIPPELEPVKSFTPEPAVGEEPQAAAESVQEIPLPKEKPVVESALWQRMFKQYPKMQVPLQENTICCLRIRPCDIGRLPRANWQYGCSHFLAQQYNRYRCLILGRNNQENEWKYFLGVPGRNSVKEQQLAREAGFLSYIAVENGRTQWPEGFWLVQLQWEE